MRNNVNHCFLLLALFCEIKFSVSADKLVEINLQFYPSAIFQDFKRPF